MSASTPSMVYLRKGKTTSNNVRSCDTVRAGAFFPQMQLQVPQKEMRQQRHQHIVVPAGVLAHFLMGHPKLRFPFFKALLDCPAYATEPDKGPQRRARWRITDRVGIHWVSPQRPLAHQPDRPLWQPLLTEDHTLAGKGIHKGPLRPCRDRARIPAGGGQVRRHSSHGTWGGLGANHHPLRAGFPLIRIAPVRRLWALEPAARL